MQIPVKKHLWILGPNKRDLWVLGLNKMDLWFYDPSKEDSDSSILRPVKEDPWVL